MFGKFGKDKVSQSVVDAVAEIMEASNIKIPTSTGTKVLGHRYGSAAAHKAQTKHDVDTLKGPSTKDLEKETKLKENACETDHDEAEEKAEMKGIADKEAKKEVKKHEKRMHHRESYTGNFASRLIDHAIFAEEVEEELNEVLSKDASAGDWIHDFVHSDNPKFKGKSKAMRKKMALAAYYAKQRNEEVEVDEELKGDQYKLDVAKPKGKLTAADFKKLRNEEEDCSCDDEGHEDEKEDKALVKKMVKKTALKNEEVEIDEARETTTDSDPNHVTTDMLKGREDGGKTNSFKSFKLKLKTDGEMKAPTATENPEDTPARNSIKAKGGEVEVKPASIHAKEEVDLEENFADEHGIGRDIADKKQKMDRLKTPAKPGPLHNVGKGLKAFLKGKPEPMESVEVEGEQIDEKEKWIQKAIKKPGALHKQLHVPADEKIPSSKLHAAAEKGGKVGKRARLALTLKKMHKEETIEEKKGLSPGQDDAPPPFDPPYTTGKPDNIKDKSGAIHTPMSRAKDLARQAMKRVRNEMLGKAPGNN